MFAVILRISENFPLMESVILFTVSLPSTIPSFAHFALLKPNSCLLDQSVSLFLCTVMAPLSLFPCAHQSSLDLAKALPIFPLLSLVQG